MLPDVLQPVHSLSRISSVPLYTKQPYLAVDRGIDGALTPLSFRKDVPEDTPPPISGQLRPHLKRLDSLMQYTILCVDRNSIIPYSCLCVELCGRRPKVVFNEVVVDIQIEANHSVSG